MGTVHPIKPTLELTAAISPVFTAADIARMTVDELHFFTDMPVAHLVAEQDFQRARRIERRNAEAVANARRLARIAFA